MTDVDELLRHFAKARAKLAKSRHHRDELAQKIQAIPAGRDRDAMTRQLAELDRSFADMQREIDTMERTLPVVTLATYHAGRRAAARADGRPDPPLDTRPPGIADWMWHQWTALTPDERDTMVEHQHDAFARRN